MEVYYYTDVYYKNLNSKSRVVVNIGGARSSKSYSIAQLIFTKFISETNKKILITGKTFPFLRRTAYSEFIKLLKLYGYYFPSNHNKSFHTYEFNGNEITFVSIDDPEKIKSTEFNYIWMEEANQFTYRDFMTLKTRLSGQRKPKDKPNQMFLTLNPIDAYGWIPKKLVMQKDVEVIRSTYKDNPFLGKDYIDILNGFKDTDKNYYKIYALGEWGQVENLIYTNYDFIDEMPANPSEVIYGMDFGYNDPSVLVEIALKDDELYVDEKLYQTKLTTSDLIEQLKTLDIKKGSPIYCDNAEPDKIEEMYRAGFNAIPAEKSVNDGIRKVKSFRSHITKESVNLIRESQGYKWKEDKYENILDEPLKFNDHAVDAWRYGVYTHFKNPHGNIEQIIIGKKRESFDLGF